MERKANHDIREQPAYGITEAAHYLRLPPATLSSWTLGRDYETADGTRRWKPLIQAVDSRHRRLSFVNLVEAHVLAAIRRDHRIRIPSVRNALNYVSQKLGRARPLWDEIFETDGASLFVEKYGALINASRQGQLTMRELLAAHLRRIERDSHRIPIRLYPARSGGDEPSCFVAIDPRIAFGRPALIGAGVPVAVLADRFRGGDSVTLLAGDYGVDRDAVEEALRQADLLRAA